jgi:hypothetical protein
LPLLEALASRVELLDGHVGSALAHVMELVSSGEPEAHDAATGLL